MGHSRKCDHNGLMTARRFAPKDMTIGAVHAGRVDMGAIERAMELVARWSGCAGHAAAPLYALKGSTTTVELAPLDIELNSSGSNSG